MPARTTEIARICSPIKGPLRHLDSSSKKLFPEILQEVVGELGNLGFKLAHVSKCYEQDGVSRADSFWIRRDTGHKIRITWLCRMTVVFQRGFRLEFDVDFWFGIPRILETLRADFYRAGFPRASSRQALKLAKREVTKILKEVENPALSELEMEFKDGLGKHGVPKNLKIRLTRKICHGTRFSVSAHPDLERFRREMKGVIENVKKVVSVRGADVREIARKKFKSLLSSPIDPNSLEGLCLLFLNARGAGGAFEYQIRRFVHESLGEAEVRRRDIERALLRLEVYGYALSWGLPRRVRKELESLGVQRASRFYSIGTEVPGQLLPEDRRKTQEKLYLEPLTREKLLKRVEAPAHFTKQAFERLIRQRVLSERWVYDSRGRMIRGIWPRRWERRLSDLEAEIVSVVRGHYSRQRKLLSIMQEKIRTGKRS